MPGVWLYILFVWVCPQNDILCVCNCQRRVHINDLIYNRSKQILDLQHHAFFLSCEFRDYWLSFTANVDVRQWYNWMETFCADIGLNQRWKNEVHCTGMLTCESTMKLTGGEITVPRCTEAVLLMKRGSLFGMTDISNIAVKLMIDRIIKYFATQIICPLLITIAFLSLISWNGSEQVFTWPSCLCACVQLEALMHSEETLGKKKI